MARARPGRVAILAAMEQEVADLRSALQVEPGAGRVVGGRDYLAGELWGVPVVLVWSRWGKVAAAITTTHVLAAFDPCEVIFTGVAGSLHRSVSVGDIVVAESLVQHDMDASPLYPRYEVPLLGRSEFPGDARVRADLLQAARGYLAHDLDSTLTESTRRALGIASPVSHVGQIISGDAFIAGATEVSDLQSRLPQALCVEMEGAAVAQVCHEHDVPFGVMRVISDNADDTAAVDFPTFLHHVAARYTHGVLRRYLVARHRA